MDFPAPFFLGGGGPPKVVGKSPDSDFPAIPEGGGGVSKSTTRTEPNDLQNSTHRGSANDPMGLSTTYVAVCRAAPATQDLCKNF